MIPKFLTHQAAEEVRTRVKLHDAWVDSLRKTPKSAVSYRPEDKPAHIPDVSDDERGMLEVYDFCKDPPDRYFAYVLTRNDGLGKVGRWVGNPIGTYRLGRKIRDNFGGYRYPIWVNGINGVKYFGYYYASSGYCRIRRLKHGKDKTPT